MLDNETLALIDKALEPAFEKVKQAMYNHYELLVNGFPKELPYEERVKTLRKLIESQIEASHKQFTVDFEYVKEQVNKMYEKEKKDGE